MKVLHVIPSLSPVRGGPGIVLRQTMAGLAARGVIVHVATTDDDGPRARARVPLGVASAEDGATVFYFPRQTSFYCFSWPLTRWLARHISEYDVVHIHALFSYPATAAAWLARRAGVPYLIRPLGTLSAWGLKTRHPLLKRCSLALIEDAALRGAAAVQATSEQERLEVLAACGGSRTIVIPNPVAMPAELPLRLIRDKARTILFLSRIDPKKGLELLLDAFNRVAANDEDFRLVIAGDGDPAYVASIRAGAAAGASRERICFTGNVAGDQKQSLFAEADLFVLPSHSENFGVAVVEAMAHGVPVLISENVGIRAEVTGALAGKVAASAAEPLALAIREMMSDPRGLVRMGQNGRRLARESYSPALVAALLIAEYERMANTGEREQSV